MSHWPTREAKKEDNLGRCPCLHRPRMQSFSGAYTPRTYTCGQAIRAPATRSLRRFVILTDPTENFGSRYSTSEAPSGACLAIAGPPSSLCRQSPNSLKTATILPHARFLQVGKHRGDRKTCSAVVADHPRAFQSNQGQVSEASYCIEDA